jgi:hypothetical protein
MAIPGTHRQRQGVEGLRVKRLCETIQQANIGDGLAEYLIQQNTAKGPTGFLMYLIPGEDGIWRIDGM